jgi:transcriptional regulator with XRE-family HTH domain
MASVTSLKADLGEYLREQRHGAKLSLRQLADLAGVSNPYLSQIERGLKKPSAEILQQLAKGLRISAESLYVRAGILDEQDDRQVETKAAILADPVLAERQKRVLLDIYDAFCAENIRTAAPADDGSDAGSDPGADPGPGAGADAATTAGTGTASNPPHGSDAEATPDAEAAPDAAPAAEPGEADAAGTSRAARKAARKTARTTRRTTPRTTNPKES